jgi:hypothetical protein
VLRDTGCVEKRLELGEIEKNSPSSVLGTYELY